MRSIFSRGVFMSSALASPPRDPETGIVPDPHESPSETSPASCSCFFSFFFYLFFLEVGPFDRQVSLCGHVVNPMRGRHRVPSPSIFFSLFFLAGFAPRLRSTLAFFFSFRTRQTIAFPLDVLSFDSPPHPCFDFVLLRLVSIFVWDILLFRPFSSPAKILHSDQ